jgi:hypothetical protein
VADAVLSVIACVGCHGIVPDIDGPIHRYMTAAPGCWRAYTHLLGGGLPPSPDIGLVVDAYAVTHPGVPGPQSTPSVWVHLLTLCFVRERRWPVERAIQLRRFGADSFSGWPWLQPPDTMGDVAAIDLWHALEARDGTRAIELTGLWVAGAWEAWRPHHQAVRARADALSPQLG